MTKEFKGAGLRFSRFSVAKVAIILSFLVCVFLVGKGLVSRNLMDICKESFPVHEGGEVEIVDQNIWAEAPYITVKMSETDSYILAAESRSSLVEEKKLGVSVVRSFRNTVGGESFDSSSQVFVSSNSRGDVVYCRFTENSNGLKMVSFVIISI